MTAAQVEWRIDAANSRLIRVVFYGWVGLLGGGILLALGLVLFFAIGAAVAREYALFALVVLLLLIGGPFSFLYLWPAIRSGSFTPLSQFVLDMASDPQESLAERYARVFSWRRVLMSIGVHAVGIPTLLVIDPRLLGGYIAIWFVSLVLVSGVQTWGRIDPTEPSFEYRSGTVPLGSVKRVRRRQVGGVIVCWLTYYAGTKSITTPSFVVLTTEAARAFDTALAAIDREPPDPRPARLAPRLVAVGIGLGSIAFAGWLWLFVDIDPGMALYVLIVFGGIGLFFIWIGIAYV